jgi:hypothetical protein
VNPYLTDLSSKNRSTEWVNPYQTGIAVRRSALKFKSAQKTVHGRRINTAILALIPSAGLLLNSPTPTHSVASLGQPGYLRRMNEAQGCICARNPQLRTIP